MKAKFLSFILASAVAPLLAQDYAVTGRHGVITAVPLQTDTTRHANLPFRELAMIEDAFTNGAQSLNVLVQRVKRLPGGGGFEFIEKERVDPTQFSDPSLREKFAPVIEAIEYDRRLQNLIDGINAAIADEDNRAQQAQQTAEEKAWKAAVRDSRRRARLYYPDAADPNSALSKKWKGVAAQMEAAKDPLIMENNADLAFIITVRAANLLGIKPVAP